MEKVTVFIVYAGHDAGWVRTFAMELEREGLKVFLRDRDLFPGDVVLGQIEAAIGTAGAAVLVLSAKTMSDPQVSDEYAAALREAYARRLRLFPVLCGDAAVAVPLILANRVPADFRGLSPAEVATKVKSLAAVIRGERWDPRSLTTRERKALQEVLDTTRPDPPPRPVQPARPSFVVTYAKADTRYGERLVDWIQEQDLPAWSIADLAWGSEFLWEIRQRIRHALALVVLMSPAAEDSPDVEHEILEGQRYNRRFFPVLLRGERNFLLASSWCFDAREGALPGESELRTLKRVYRDHVMGRTPAAPPQPSPVPSPVRHVAADARRRSGAEVHRLRAFLGEGELAHADLLTTNMLLAEVGRLERGWLDESDGARLPDSLLTDIDDAWSELTAQRQGFRRQRRLCRLHDEYGGGFLALATAYGWRSAPDGRPSYGELAASPKYGDLVDRAAAHDGFFPTLRNPQVEQYPAWSDRWRKTVLAVHRRLRGWQEEE